MPLFRAGSSPHARGARNRIFFTRRVRGIIPACAGSTAVAFVLQGVDRDHPRMRGEHAMPRSFASILRGSSPHARGARSTSRLWICSVGIIPACAGSTFGAGSRPWTERDHPRMRGEHAAICEGWRRRGGSSPHARGALRNAVKIAAKSGIIPACAGSTCGQYWHHGAARDHPRMRGEHRDSFMGLASVLGSSPHARGARSCGACGACGPGIIPACAGSTPQVLPQAMIWRDHPRMRGEHYRIGGSVFNDGGSSPHARGALLVVVTCCCYAGIIPACAGSTRVST